MVDLVVSHEAVEIVVDGFGADAVARVQIGQARMLELLGYDDNIGRLDDAVVRRDEDALLRESRGCTDASV